ncbi:MAG: hypothetical protein V1735_07370 [Nanoarchaeota archaeon]
MGNHGDEEKGTISLEAVTAEARKGDVFSLWEYRMTTAPWLRNARVTEVRVDSDLNPNSDYPILAETEGTLQELAPYLNEILDAHKDPGVILDELSVDLELPEGGTATLWMGRDHRRHYFATLEPMAPGPVSAERSNGYPARYLEQLLSAVEWIFGPQAISHGHAADEWGRNLPGLPHHT